jgi:hypothetical protein
LGDGSVHCGINGLQERSKSPRVVKQLVYFLAQIKICSALRVQIGCPLLLRRNFEGI